MTNPSKIIPISEATATVPLVLVALKIANLCAKPAAIEIVDGTAIIAGKRLFLMAAAPGPGGAFPEANAHALETGSDGIVVRRGSSSRRPGQLEFDVVLAGTGRTEWLPDLRICIDRFDGTWLIPARRSGHAIWVGSSGLIPSTAVARWAPGEIAAALDRVPDQLWPT